MVATSSMNLSPLDAATQLEPAADGCFQVVPSADYWNFESAFGGWGLALAEEAVRSALDERAPVASVNALFLKPLSGELLWVRPRLLRRGRRAGFYRVEISADEEGTDVVLSVDLVFAEPASSTLEYIRAFPSVSSIDESPVMPSSPGPRWLAHYEQRIALGKPFSAQESPHSAIWLRDLEGRPWDAKGLLAASDTPMPRTFFLDETPRFGSTVTYTLQVFASPEELAMLGREPLLIEANGDAIRHGRYSQVTYIWSAGEKLVATSYQLGFFAG
jgi:hypothetical protein